MMLPRSGNGRAVVLLSGGMDSSTVLYIAVKQHNKVVDVVSIDYGQRHKRELEAAYQVYQRIKSEKPNQVLDFKKLSIDLTQIGGSPLTSSSLTVPKRKEQKQRLTVVPFRNTIHLTLAAAYAETKQIYTIYHGACKDDAENYPDCRYFYFKSLESTLEKGSTYETKFTIITPVVDMWKADIVRLGLSLGVPYELTWTCYLGEKKPCYVLYNLPKEEACDACFERIRAFETVGVEDPLR